MTSEHYLHQLLLQADGGFKLVVFNIGQQTAQQYILQHIYQPGYMERPYDLAYS